MQHRIACFADVVRRWDKVAHFANDIGVTDKHAFGMILRNSIPANYWAAVLKGAHARGYREITAELLLTLAANAAQQLRRAGR